MIITVASGKGGTGKTMVATNLALSIEGAQSIDCDVEEPNGNLFLHAEIKTRREAGIPMPVIDEERCTLCGNCAEACEFNALAVSKKRVLLFSDLCHGCGVCSYVCPEPGVITEPTLSGIHDIQRVEALCRHFRVPALVCINKYDINPENTGTIKDYCLQNQVPVIGEIPFSPAVRQALVTRKSPVDFDCGVVTGIVERMWSGIEGRDRLGSDWSLRLSE